MKLDEIRKKVLTLEQNVMKRERQEALDIALAEGEITQYLPLSELGEDCDFLFSNPTTTRCISNYIWSVLEHSGLADPNLTQLTTTDNWRENLTRERLTSIIRYGNAVGALTSTKQGTIPAMPSAAQVEAFLQDKLIDEENNL